MHGKEAGRVVHGKLAFWPRFDMEMSGAGGFFIEKIDRFRLGRPGLANRVRYSGSADELHFALLRKCLVVGTKPSCGFVLLFPPKRRPE
jgi:hypothetical protein